MHLEILSIINYSICQIVPDTMLACAIVRHRFMYIEDQLMCVSSTNLFAQYFRRRSSRIRALHIFYDHIVWVVLRIAKYRLPKRKCVCVFSLKLNIFRPSHTSWHLKQSSSHFCVGPMRAYVSLVYCSNNQFNGSARAIPQRMCALFDVKNNRI